MDRTRIGVIGLGPNAQTTHLPALASFDDVELVALCDTDSDRLETVGRRYAVDSLFTSHQEMLEKVSLEGVSVVTAVAAVGPVAEDCLGAGIKTLVEKPPGVTLKDSQRLKEAAKAGNTWGMVAFNRRFAPLVQEAKRLVEAEGPVLSIITEFHPFMGTALPPSWKASLQPLVRLTLLQRSVSQKSVLPNFEYYRKVGLSEEALRHFHAAQSIHSVDLMHFLGGRVREVHGAIYSPLTPYGDSFNAMIRFESGAIGQLICNYSSPTRIERAQIYGNGIAAILEGVPPTARPPYSFAEVKVYRGQIKHTITSERDDSIWNAGFTQENRYFVDCIQNDRFPVLPAADLDEAVRTMEIIDAVLTQSGR